MPTIELHGDKSVMSLDISEALPKGTPFIRLGGDVYAATSSDGRVFKLKKDESLQEPHAPIVEYRESDSGPVLFEYGDPNQITDEHVETSYTNAV